MCMSHKYIFVAILAIISCACTADELEVDYWKKQYSSCVSSFPLVLLGKVTELQPLEYNDGGKGYGYTKFNVSVNTVHLIKGTAPGSFQYTVWYEGKEGATPGVQGEALLCLSIDANGEFYDGEGFGRLPTNPELRKYARSLSPSTVNKASNPTP
jgi:hypothetical protein